MKVIDLLNKIAKGEEVPKRIRIDHWCYKFEWKDYARNYIDEREDADLMSVLSCDREELNYEVRELKEDKKDEEIEIYVNGKKVDITDIYEPLKQGEYFYKENGKWYVHRLENISILLEENKTIGKLYLNDEYLFSNNLSKEFTREDRRLLDSNFKELGNKINAIIDYINKEE